MDPCTVLTAVTDSISRVGFPIVVAGFVLWRLESTLRQNTEALHALRRGLLEYGVSARGGPPGRSPEQPAAG